jgi:hypothetical protein
VILFGIEIRRAGPRFARQRDLFFKCPKCGKYTKLRRCDDGESLLTKLYDVETIDRIELECPCGGMVTIGSVEEVSAISGPVDWDKIFKKVGV